MARRWAARLRRASALADTIATTATTYRLVPGAAPSTTVSIVRWTDVSIDVLVLGDSPVVGLTCDGRTHEVRDDRLSRVAGHQRQALHESAAHMGFDRAARWQALVESQRKLRNKPTGYWIAEAVPEAAAHAVRVAWRPDDVIVVLAATDGIANGVLRYRVPQDWYTAITIAREDPAQLVTLIHDAEDSDPDGARWPRTKRHDDKAIAVVDFTGARTGSPPAADTTPSM
jgi:hypothetical protein